MYIMPDSRLSSKGEPGALWGPGGRVGDSHLPFGAYRTITVSDMSQPLRQMSTKCKETGVQPDVIITIEDLGLHGTVLYLLFARLPEKPGF